MPVRFSSHVRHEADGNQTLDLLVEGMKCASCALKVREALERGGAATAQVDLTSGHASVHWQGPADKADEWAARIDALGYRALPFDAGTAHEKEEDTASALARYALVASLATLGLMSLGLAAAPRLWLMGAITIAALAYAGRPLLFSAYRALRHGNVNMDVPISLALILTTGLSLFEAAQKGVASYFDSVTMLLMFLLIGRYLDQKARGKARRAATGLLALFSGKATILEGETQREIPIRSIEPGMILVVAAGEKIAADGQVMQGLSEVDPSIVTGETIPEPVAPGAPVVGGMTNLSAPLFVRVSAAGSESVVGEIVKLMEKAEQGHARFVRLADKVARLYTPAVFGFALAAFAGWFWGLHAPWDVSLMTAATVLIITCPCAMGLAVPAVQILASARLFKNGLLLKTADALEKLAKVDTIVFDKTGTLTMGQPQLINRADITTDELKLAASLAVQSHHPLAQAILDAHGAGPIYALDVAEYPGQGLEAAYNGETVRLGRSEWCGPQTAMPDEAPEMWLRVGYTPPRRLAFADKLRPDAGAVIAELKKQDFNLYLMSGDREAVVADVSKALGLYQARSAMTPADKAAALEGLKAQGRHVLMIGDGLNDAAALVAADVSLSPASALDITQNAADMVFQGDRLAPVLDSLAVAKKTEKLVRENMAFALIYNLIAVPIAMAGLVTPPLAAAAMSFSSLAVILNAQRMRRV